MRRRVLVGDVAVRAVEVAGKAPRFRHGTFAGGTDEHPPVPDAQRRLHPLHQAGTVRRCQAGAVLDHLQDAFLLPVDAGVSLTGQKPLHLVGGKIGRHRHREGNQHNGPGAGIPRQQLIRDALGRVPPHRPAAAAAEEPRGPGEQELQVVVQLRHGPHGGAGGAHRVGLVDGDGRRNPVDPVHGRAVHPLQELTGIGGKGLHVAALPLGVDRIEGERRLPRTGNAGDDNQLAQGKVEIEILQVILAGVADGDRFVGHGERV
ncbi:hypothetical protein [Geobacter anodireducens]|uniref:hypothetical protein n=1 Tax=Geobacter soli TaxID=1510391 RepID=UPI00126A572E|nr:hypothetical protein [Geobacter soli]